MKKTIMMILAVLSGIAMTVTLIMINCFGIMALYNAMSCATLVFIMSGAYLTGCFSFLIFASPIMVLSIK